MYDRMFLKRVPSRDDDEGGGKIRFWPLVDRGKMNVTINSCGDISTIVI